MTEHPRARPSYSDKPETPLGIKLIAVLGFVGAFLSLLASVGPLTAGGARTLLAGGLLLQAFAQAVTMLALVSLTPWSWYATVGLFTLSFFANAVRGEALSAGISLLIAAYGQKDLFEAGG